MTSLLAPTALTQFVNVMSTIMAVMGGVTAVFGGVKIVANVLAGRPEPVQRGMPMVFMGMAMATVGIFLPGVFTSLWGGLFDGIVTPTPSSTPPPKTSAPSEPADPSVPADLTWLWVVLGALAALVLLCALALLVITTARRARQARERAVADKRAREKVTAAWAGVHARHDELLRKLLHSETDWDALFFTPALTDPNVPATAAMLLAMRAAGTARDISGDMPRALLRTDGGASALADQPYPKAVDAFDLAWDAAERNARRLGQKGIPAAERKTIKEIRDLLNIAENSAASSTERNLAYRRAQKLITSLEHVHVPERATAQLEQSHALMLEATTAR